MCQKKEEKKKLEKKHVLSINRFDATKKKKEILKLYNLLTNQNRASRKVIVCLL